jgi:hypothetical protein
VIEKRLDVETPDGSMPTFVFHPAHEGPHPVVLYLMDAPGIRRALTEDDVLGQVHGRGRSGADGCQQPVPPSEHLTDPVDHARDGHLVRLQVAPL